MQKGIGAAPFAIVAALIIALAAGFWVTQTTQAAQGDVLLTVTDVTDTSSFNEPNTVAGNTDAFGPPGLTVETLTAREGAFAADDKNVFRGAADRGAWVEMQAVVDSATTGTPESRAFSLLLSVSGEAQLTSTGLTSGTLASQEVSTGVQAVQFPVWTTGTPGGFSVTAAPAETGLLTAAVATKAATVNGQWVGEAVSGEALTAKPAGSALADDATLGTFSPSSFVGGATAGLDAATGVGFLFQLKDSAGQVALNTVSTGANAARDDLRVRVIKELGVDLSFAASLSVGTAGTTAYVDIGDETFSSGYPTAADPNAGGLVGVALTPVTLGDAAVGRIVLDLPGGGTLEHAFAISGHPDKDMSSVGAAGSPVNLKAGAEHTRMVTLRDANGTPVMLPAIGDDPTSPAAGSAPTVIKVTEDETPGDLIFTVGNAKADAPGVYPITIKASEESATGVTPVTRNATVGNHAFKVAIHQLGLAVDAATTANRVVEKSADADGDPLEAHVGGAITALTVVSVQNRAGDEILTAGSDTVDAAARERLTVTVLAVGANALLPANGESVEMWRETGQDPERVAMTNDAGEVTFRVRTSDETTTLEFSVPSPSTVFTDLVVNVADPDAPAEDAGPRIYTLASQAGGDFHNWTGGVGSSSEFENVANLVAVWKWTGGMWVGYVSAPNAPAATKTNYSLQDGDTLFVVANGPVDLTLD